jgi:excisionase family DNA binding protein
MPRRKVSVIPAVDPPTSLIHKEVCGILDTSPAPFSPRSHPALRGLMAPLLITKEVAILLRVNPRTVQRLVHDRRIPVVFVGRSMRFRPEAISKFISDMEVLAARPAKLRSARKLTAVA